jgi:transcriptional regulator with XRE-family HTH domain
LINQDLAKKVKELRKRSGISQELLAENSGLSLRTIQRIENGETQPTGDSIRKLSSSLNVTPNELIDWQIIEDNNVLLLLNLSQLGFIAFPLLGILIPLIIWTSKKDKIKDVDQVGKSILNFQISWTLLLFLMAIFIFITAKLELQIGISFVSILIAIGGMYFINIIIVLFNTLRYHSGKPINYKPSFPFLS